MGENEFIPFHKPSIGREEFEAVQKVLSSGWLTTGPVAMEFEKQFASYVGAKHAIAVNSCTAALQLALDAINLRPGEEVLVPTNTFTSTGEVVTYFGGRPVLCDSTSGGFNLDPVDVERRITPRTRAIIPVHIAGESCDLAAIHRIAERHNLHVIEDAAHAIPTRFHGRKIGSISEMTAFSFYTTKTITTGEGGMLTTDNDRYAERASLMRLHGIGRDAWKRYAKSGSWFYEVREAGYKMNLPDLLAALGVAQLQKADQLWQQRAEIADYYKQEFSDVEELEMPPAITGHSEHAWHLFILRIRPGILAMTRDEFIEHLKKEGIGTSVHFIPLHRHPYYIREFGCKAADFPNAEDAFSRCVSLPIFPDLSRAQQKQVVSTVKQLISEYSRKALAY